VSLDGRIESWSKNENTLNLQYLVILESMIKLGFYKTENELFEILDPLIKILDGSLDFYTKDEAEHYHKQLEENPDVRPVSLERN